MKKLTVATVVILCVTAVLSVLCLFVPQHSDGGWTVQLDEQAISSSGLGTLHGKMSPEDSKTILGIWNGYDHTEGGLTGSVPVRFLPGYSGGSEIFEYFPADGLLQRCYTAGIGEQSGKTVSRTYSVLSENDNETIVEILEKYHEELASWTLKTGSKEIILDEEDRIEIAEMWNEAAFSQSLQPDSQDALSGLVEGQTASLTVIINNSVYEPELLNIYPDIRIMEHVKTRPDEKSAEKYYASSYSLRSVFGRTAKKYGFELPTSAVKEDPVPGDFKIEPDRLYVEYIYLSGPVTEDGFAASVAGKDFFFTYPGADSRFSTFQTLLVTMYGRNIEKTEKRLTYTFDNGKHEETVVCEYVVKQVESARLSDWTKGEPIFDKPIVYLYPEVPTRCSVQLDLDGRLTCSYPAYTDGGWSGFIANPDGTLTFEDGREYYALYWEGEVNAEFDMSRGFCVKGSDTAVFLEDVLPRLGLSAREANEFIVYWLPRMQGNEYNLIAFQTDAYTDSARLEINPQPDTLIRVFMVYKPLSAPVEIEPQTFETPARRGFVAVEWGGSVLRG